MKVFPANLYLNLNNDHFSLITDISKFAQFWRCEHCDRVTQRRNNYMKHMQICKGAVAYEHPGGGFGNRLTIFEELQDEGFQLGDREPYYPFYIVYDFEARFEAVDLQGARLVFEKRLIPVSVSIQSNVPGFMTPVCFVERDPKVLIEKFYAHLVAISDAAYEIMADRFSDVVETLDVATAGNANNRETLQNLRNARGDAKLIERIEGDISQNAAYDFLGQKWSRWLRQIPVLGFNSGSFDLQLIRKHFIPHVMSQGHEILNPITRGSSYLTISTEKLLFLDVKNYIAPNTSYKKWLGAFGVEEQKVVWPYEYLTDFDRLSETRLPPIEAFYSTLKGEGISAEEYQGLQELWARERFGTLKDLLVHYNNLDAGPFLVALEKMCTMFKTMNIDMLKSGNISLPGLAMVKMFQNIPPDTIFQIYNKANKDILERVQANIVGGPAIIFKRLVMEGVGSVKGGPPPQAVEGHDSNGLYPSTFKDSFTSGIGMRYDPIDGVGEPVAVRAGTEHQTEFIRKMQANKQRRFKISSTCDSNTSLNELIVVNTCFQTVQARFPTETLTLRHHWNGGQKMFRIGKQRIPVDGWIPEKKIIIQYHGCYHHGHYCAKTWDRFTQAQLQPEAARTDEITSKLRGLGFEVLEFRECEFEQLQLTNPQFASYVKSFQMPKPRRKAAMADQILTEIKRDEFFGMVEVELQVPWWNPALRRKMAEFPPLFKNVEISIDDVGDTMAAFAREQGYLKKSRRGPISSYFAEKKLMTTPMLKWCMAHNLSVTRVYFAVQYIPTRVFAHLPEEVARQRRSADANPDQKTYGELFKLLANSYFGKCLTNVAKFRKIHYLFRPEAARKIQSPLYRKVEPIGEAVYEVHMAKSTVKYSLPINIAFFVYSYAKLRMLAFYYDFLLRVLSPNSFELIEMDTDSLYLGMVGPSLESLVPPGPATLIYNQIKHLYLVLTDYDKRTPGLFKLEWKGTGMIAISPKTYIAFSMGEGAAPGITNLKVSTKGISKQTNQWTVENFLNVILTQNSLDGVNRGFMVRDGELQQYRQERRALTYLYIKRKVLPDGIHTIPLDL